MVNSRKQQRGDLNGRVLCFSASEWPCLVDALFGMFLFEVLSWGLKIVVVAVVVS